MFFSGSHRPDGGKPSAGVSSLHRPAGDWPDGQARTEPDRYDNIHRDSCPDNPGDNLRPDKNCPKVLLLSPKDDRIVSTVRPRPGRSPHGQQGPYNKSRYGIGYRDRCLVYSG